MVVFVEPFGRPRLACGFDFFGEVFTAGNVSERCRPTSVMSQPINVDHQNENKDQFILTLRLCLCQSWLLCASKYQSNLSRHHTNTYKPRRFCDVFKFWREAHIPMHCLICEDRNNHHHNTWEYFVFVNYSCRHYNPSSFRKKEK